MLKENRYDRPPFWFVLLTGILPAFLIFWAWEQFPAFGGSAGSLSAYGRLGLHDRVAHDAKGNGTVIGPGRNRYFVRVQFDGEQEGQEMEALGLRKI